MSSGPGYSVEQLFEELSDQTIDQLLPQGAYRIIQMLQPDTLAGSRRHKALADLFSVELAIDDLERRLPLLSALPAHKARELETRVGTTIDELCAQSTLTSNTRRSILGFFGIATTPDRMVKHDSTLRVDPVHSLFPFQKQAAADIEHYLYRENRRAMLHLPTGVGKTRVAMSVIASHLRSQKKALVIWLANTRELLEQAASEFELTWTHVGDRRMLCHRFWGQNDAPSDSQDDGIIIAGLAKLHSFGRIRERLWSLGDRTTLLVFDEAHQAVATTYKDLINTLITRNPRTGLLGLSATPGRTWNDPQLDEAVSELFHGNKVTLDLGDDNPIKRLTHDGYLARASFSLLNIEPGFRMSPAEVAEMAHTLDIPEHIAEALGLDEQRNLRIVQRLLELLERHDRILVFAASVANAQVLSSVCRALGLRADAVTAKTDKTQRQFIIERFRRQDNSKRILINFGILTTGFDAPAASGALIARPTRSLVLYSQMVGRVIRGRKAGGTESCEVVTVVDTSLPGFGDVAKAFVNWEDIWSR